MNRLVELRARRRGHGARSGVRPRVRLVRRPLAFERLEPLTLLAAVSWINTSGGDWFDGANWSGGAVPGALDDVVIDQPGVLSVSIAGPAAARSLQCSEDLTVQGGATLTIFDASTVQGGLTLGAGSLLTASGPAAALIATGPTTFDGANLQAVGGGRIELAAASYAGGSWDQSIRAEGLDSVISFPNLATLQGSTGSQGWTVFHTYVDAVDGGRIELPAVASVTNQVAFRASAPRSWTDDTSISLPALTSLSGGGTGQVLSADGSGRIDAPSLAVLDSTSLYAYNGAHLVLDAAASYSGGSGTDRTIRAEGAGSLIRLPALAALAGGSGSQGWTIFTTYVTSGDGGVVDLPALASVTLQTALTVSGPGQILAPSLQSLDATSLYAYAGGQLVLPAVVSVVGGQGIDRYIRAEGPGCFIRLPNLTALSGSSGSQGWTNFTTYVDAVDGGTIDLPLVATVDRQTAFRSHTTTGQPAGLIDLPALTTFAGGGTGQALSVAGAGVIHAPLLQTLLATSLYAYAGGHLSLPAANVFDGRGGVHHWIHAEGAGSLIDLPALTTLRGGDGSQGWTNFTTYIESTGGASVALGSQVVSLWDRIGVAATSGAVTAGTLDNQAGANLSAVGTLGANVVNRGYLTPLDDQCVTLHVAGDFTQTASGILSMQLHGATVGLYDVLQVDGRATLDGALAVSRPWGFAPTDGDRFPILTFASRTWDFAAKLGLDLGAGHYLRAVYAAAGMELVAGTTPDPGPQTGTAPTALDDAYSVAEGASLTIAAPGVLGNDSDPDLDALTATLLAGPASGALTLAPDGSFTYTPAPGYTGTVSFTYQAFDGTLLSNAATVTITVTPVNHAPTLTSAANSVAVDEGQSASLVGTFADIDGDLVALAASVGSITVGPSGDWTWTYTPADGPGDSQTVTVTADDGHGGVGSLTFSLTVTNLAPVLASASTDASTVGARSPGQTVTLSASFADPGVLDVHTAVVDWGDGHVSSAVVTEAGGLGTLTSGHIYSTGGIYTITLTLADDAGASANSTLTAYITGARRAGAVLQIVGTHANDVLNLAPTGDGGVSAQAAFLGAAPLEFSPGLTAITVVLGGGADTLAVSQALPAPLSADAGDGNDTFRGWGLAFTTAALVGGSGADRILNPGLDGGLALASFGPSNSIETIAAVAGLLDQHIEGTEAADVLDFSATTFTAIGYVDGLGGNDRVVGGVQGNDLRGGDGSDTVLGGPGNDTIRGGAGDDLIDGGTGSDRLITESGDADTILGGDGNDTFWGWGDAFLGDVLDGGSGADRILNPGLDGGLVLASFGPSNSIETIAGVAGLLDQHIEGTEAADVLDFSATTFSAVKYVDALGGDDWLRGTSQANDLRGGEGSDTLIGTNGADSLTGGNGDDIFRFLLDDVTGRDVVTDFVQGLDRIDLSAYQNLSFSALLAATVQSGADVLITLPTGKQIRVKNVQRSALSASDFLGLV